MARPCNHYLPYDGRRSGTFRVLSTKRFTGQYHESSLPGGEGLSYYNARWYDAKLGRFLSADTIVPGPANPQAFNRYSYVFNNPLNFTDPSGHDPWGGRWEDPRDRLHGVSDLLPPTIQQLYNTFYRNFRAHPVAQFYDGRWSTFAQDFVAATQATGATNLVGYKEMADHMANSLAGRGKGATGGLISTSDALYFFLLGLDNDFQQIVAQKENERVGQLMGVLGMSFMFSSALGGPCSFANDTLVATADGLKSITEIKVGELVYAYNETTGAVGLYPVTAELAHLDREIVTLVINGERIVTTPEHPFYTTANDWMPAGVLQIGDEIRRADGSVGTVQSITVAERPQVMYNLTVTDAHTFFVGRQGWLVHNQCPPYDRSAFGEWKPGVRRDVIARDGGRCVYCRETDDLTVDHVTPVKQVWEEGAYSWTSQERNDWFNDPNNLVTACRTCNSRKNSDTLLGFIRRFFGGD